MKCLNGKFFFFYIEFEQLFPAQLRALAYPVSENFSSQLVMDLEVVASVFAVIEISVASVEALVLIVAPESALKPKLSAVFASPLHP